MLVASSRFCCADRLRTCPIRWRALHTFLLYRGSTLALPLAFGGSLYAGGVLNTLLDRRLQRLHCSASQVLKLRKLPLV